MLTSIARFAAPLVLFSLAASPPAAAQEAACTVDGHSYMVLVSAEGLAGVNDYVNLERAVTVLDGSGPDPGGSALRSRARFPVRRARPREQLRRTP